METKLKTSKAKLKANKKFNGSKAGKVIQSNSNAKRNENKGTLRIDKDLLAQLRMVEGVNDNERIRNLLNASKSSKIQL